MTPWSDWLTELDLKHVRSAEGLADIMSWDIKRGRSFQCIVQLLYCCDHLPQYSQPISGRVELWLSSRVHEPMPVFRKQIEQVLTTFYNIGSDPRLNRAFTVVSARIAPVEFVFIGVLIATLLGVGEETVAKEVGLMRTHVRKFHRDIRSNTNVYGTLWDFIDEAQIRNRRSVLTWVSTSQELSNQLSGVMPDRRVHKRRAIAT